MSTPGPLVIVGLDGGDWAVLDRLIAAGQLPALSRLAAEGLRTELRSTLPPATLPAWTAFLCAAEPSEHGVLDMFVHPPESYLLVPATASLRRRPTFLERLAHAGLAVASLGVPGTYPPLRALGLCVSGFDAPGAARAGPRSVWPPEFHGELVRLGGWRYAVLNEQRRRRDPGEIARALVADLEVKERVILAAWRRRRWDVFFVHLQAGDTAGHHLWHTFDTRSPRFAAAEHADALPAVYRRLDAVVGRLRAELPAGARLLVVSDHGMAGASDVAVHLNRVLHEAGLLTFRRAGPIGGLLSRVVRAASGGLSPELFGLAVRAAPRAVLGRLLALARRQSVDYAKTLAFSDELDYGPAVWLNRAGVFPLGRVSPADASRVLARARAALLGLVDPSGTERLVTAVHERRSPDGPDLVIEPAWPGGYRPSFVPSSGPGPAVRRLAGTEFAAPRGAGMPGVHRREGVFLAHGPGLPAVEVPALSIAEAGALVHALAGFAAPDDLGVRLRGFWSELAASLGAAPARGAVAADPPAGYNAAERAVVTRRLRDLGYIE